MITGAKMLLEDVIVALSFRNMFLSISKSGHEGPSTILWMWRTGLNLQSAHTSVTWKLAQWYNFSTDSTRLAIVGAMQSAIHMAV